MNQPIPSAPTTDDDAHPAPKVLEQLIQQAERAGASDIHLQMRGPAAEIAFRLDGVIAPVKELTPDLAERVFGRIKFLAKLKTYQESLPQDGRIDRAELGSQNDIRVATYPTVSGEKIVLRLFNSATAKNLGDLELPENTRANATAWRWELELQPRAKKFGSVKPLFTFIAVPAGELPK